MPKFAKQPSSPLLHHVQHKTKASMEFVVDDKNHKLTPTRVKTLQAFADTAAFTCNNKMWRRLQCRYCSCTLLHVNMCLAQNWPMSIIATMRSTGHTHARTLMQWQLVMWCCTNHNRSAQFNIRLQTANIEKENLSKTSRHFPAWWKKAFSQSLVIFSYKLLIESSQSSKPNSLLVKNNLNFANKSTNLRSVFCDFAKEIIRVLIQLEWRRGRRPVPYRRYG